MPVTKTTNNQLGEKTYEHKEKTQRILELGINILYRWVMAHCDSYSHTLREMVRVAE